MDVSLVSLVHLVATLLLVGLILVVQLVHYPLMAQVGAEAFPAYHRAHATRISWLVGPLMPTELVSAVWLALLPPTGVEGWVPWAGVALVAVVWLSTALVQIPCHARLEGGFDAAVHRRLVRSNWIRTVAWLARVPVAVLLALS